MTRAPDLPAAFRAAFPDWRAPWSAAAFETFAQDPTITWLEAQAGDGGLAGLLIARSILDQAELLTLFRLPRACGRGVGSALTSALIAEFTNKEIMRITLEVSNENVVARALYHRFAFREVGCRPGYYLQSGGRANDALILARDFSRRQYISRSQSNAKET